MEKRQQLVQDQAEHLRSKIAAGHIQLEEVHKSLPPRSEFHKNKTKKVKWKIKYPVVRLLVVFFILLPIILLSIYYYKSENVIPTQTEPNDSGFTRIEIGD